MKSIFDKLIRDELTTRISSLHETSNAQWGKMSLYQMLKHCSLWEEMIVGKRPVKRILLGRIIGKMALKIVLKDNGPLGKNTPSSQALLTKEKNGDIALQKKIWINMISEYEHVNNPEFIHPFFGTMTKEQIGLFVYKHSDHHLRQFGV